LRIARLCKEFNCLPWQGGLLQQGNLNVKKLEAVMDAQNKYQEYKSKSTKSE
jgi:hypothetical protein